MAGEIMPNLYLCEQGAVVRKSSRRIIVEKNKKTLDEIPVTKVDRLIVFGNIQLTTQALALLLDNGIDVSFLTLRGRLRGVLKSNISKNIFLRLAQYERFRDIDYKHDFCCSVIEAKLINMKFVMQRYLSNYPEEDFSSYLKTINHGLVSLEDNNKDIQRLLGIEGASSGAYFAAFGKMFRHELTFKKRLRHPSPDPVNALLSLGYTMITNEIASNLEGLSFEPYLGFLHGIKYGRKSLALDMVEEFRQPLIDTFTLKLANLKLFTPDDFVEVPGEGVHLIEEKFKEYLNRYEQKMHENVAGFSLPEQNWRKLFQRQARRLEKAILEGMKYLPFKMEKGSDNVGPGGG